MALILADRVKETTNTTGTGTVTLAGAVAQFQAFSAGIGSANTTYYTLLSGNGVDWETGLGTVGGAGPYTLARTTVYASSNGGSAINLSGVSTVFCDLPASKVPAAGGLATLAKGLTVPASASFSWLNQGTASATDQSNGPLTLLAPATAGNNIRMFVQAVQGSTPWTLTAEMAITQSLVSQHSAGIVVTDGTKLIALWSAGVSNVSSLYLQRWSNVTTFAANTYGAGWQFAGPAAFFRVHDDGANYTWSVSGDGVDFTTLITESHTAFLTATQVGFALMSSTTADGATLANVWGYENVTGAGTVLGW